MQNIWLDLGSIKSDSAFWNFVLKMITELIEIDTKNNYTLFCQEQLEIQAPNFTSIKIQDTSSLQNDLSFCNMLKQKKYNLVIFFDASRKLFYKWRHYSFLESLQELSYPSQRKKNFIDKYLFRHFLDIYIWKSEKVLCFDSRTKEELNESFDKKEEDISMIPGFFSKAPLNISGKEDLNPFMNLKNEEYLIYEGGSGANKNLEKLIKAIKLVHREGFHIKLYIVWDELLKDIQIREYIVHNDAADLIDVLWEIDDYKKEFYYENALWVVLPSLYESFPFNITNAVFYEKKIIASNIPSLKKIFWENIEYFNPLSINQISEKLLWIKKQKTPDYEKIVTAFTPKTSAQRMLYEIEN